mmetsp:Transcript_127593/g.190191  ORF Transcript_127593/g.190191 Transcript_127593/m.190191 type:complete len:413 (-) Transcript_127593:751-1989(-)
MLLLASSEESSFFRLFFFFLGILPLLVIFLAIFLLFVFVFVLFFHSLYKSLTEVVSKDSSGDMLLCSCCQRSCKAADESEATLLLLLFWFFFVFELVFPFPFAFPSGFVFSILPRTRHGNTCSSCHSNAPGNSSSNSCGVAIVAVLLLAIIVQVCVWSISFITSFTIFSLLVSLVNGIFSGVCNIIVDNVTNIIANGIETTKISSTTTGHEVSHATNIEDLTHHLSCDKFSGSNTNRGHDSLEASSFASLSCCCGGCRLLALRLGFSLVRSVSICTVWVLLLFHLGILPPSIVFVFTFALAFALAVGFGLWFRFRFSIEAIIRVSINVVVKVRVCVSELGISSVSQSVQAIGSAALEATSLNVFRHETVWVYEVSFDETRCFSKSSQVIRVGEDSHGIWVVHELITQRVRFS